MRLSLIHALILFAPLPLLADIAPSPVHDGRSPGPSEGTSSVEMAAEEVTLDLHPKELRVEAVFHMRNPGKEDVRLQVGFPVGHDKDALQDFRAMRDGQAFDLGVEDRGGKNPMGKFYSNWWIVWNAVYPAGKTVTETVSYRMPVSRQAGYILHTGAGWAGKIGKAVVILKLADGLTCENLRSLSPAGFEHPGCAVAGRPFWTGAQWTFVDLKPTVKDDIRIEFNAEQTLAEQAKALEQAADPNTHAQLVELLGRAMPFLDKAGKEAYWRAAGRLLDDVIPQGIPKGKSLDLDYNGAVYGVLAYRRTTFDLLHEAAGDRKDLGASAALPRLRDLAQAWMEGRIRIDYRQWKKTRRNVVKWPDPDFEPLPFPEGLDRAQLKADLNKETSPKPSGTSGKSGQSGPPLDSGEPESSSGRAPS